MSDINVNVSPVNVAVSVQNTPINIVPSIFGIQGPPGAAGSGVTSTGSSTVDLSGYITTGNADSRYITGNPVFVTGTQIISGEKTFQNNFYLQNESSIKVFSLTLGEFPDFVTKDFNNVASIDFINRILYDSNGIFSCKFSDRILYGSNFNSSIDWENKTLNNIFGDTVLNWENKIITGSWNIDTANFSNLTISGNSISTGGSFYPYSNPDNFCNSGFAAAISGELNQRLYNTGNSLINLINASNAGVSSINSKSGILSITGAGDVSILVNGQTFTISGNTGYLLNYSTNLNVFNTGQNNFNSIVNLSGQLNLTGTNLQNQINSLNSISKVTGLNITGSNSITGLILFTGIGGLAIYLSGNTIQISGGATTSLNGLITTGNADSRYLSTGISGNLVTSTNGVVTVKGGATINNGQFLIGESGGNSYQQGDIYGSTGINIISGSGALGISITNNVLTGIIAGTGTFIQNNNNGTFTIGSSGLIWNLVSGNVNLKPNNGYVVNWTGLSNLTIPSSSTFGNILRITSICASGFKILQNSQNVIYFGNATTTVGTGGFISSTNNRDSIELLAIENNSGWNVISSVGNFNIS